MTNGDEADANTLNVWKYEIRTIGIPFIHHMPLGAEILEVDTQFHEPMMWALVDPNRKIEPRVFKVVGTGQEGIPVGSTYLGTFQLDMGRFVGHLFELRSAKLSDGEEIR